MTRAEQRLLNALQTGSKSYRELAEELQLCYGSIQERASALRIRGLLRIESFRKTAGRPRFVVSIIKRESA